MADGSNERDEEPAGCRVTACGGGDRGWIERLLRERWGSTRVVSRGRVHQADRLPALRAELDGEDAGLLTYEIRSGELEVVTLDALRPGRGVGTALLAAAAAIARSAGCRRLWLVTTDDNEPALAFYQARGLSIAARREGAIDAYRRIKPEIPRLGVGDRPMRDEIEMEWEVTE